MSEGAEAVPVELDLKKIPDPPRKVAKWTETGISPEWTSSYVSDVFFSWVNALFALGNLKNRLLKEEDMFPLSGLDKVADVSEQFETNFRHFQKQGVPSPLVAALRKQFLVPLALAGVRKWVNSTLQFGPPIILNFFLAFLEDRASGVVGSDQDWKGYVWIIGLFALLTVRTLVENSYFHRVARVGFQVRTAISTAVYKKALRLSPIARQENPVGQIVNLMQLDASRLDSVCLQLNVIWDGIYQIIGYMVLLIIYIGPSALAGLATMLLLIPLNFIAMRAIGMIRRRISGIQDNRIKVTNEVLQGIRAIKLCSWEGFFTRKLFKLRDSELHQIKRYAVQHAVNSTLMNTAPILVSVVTLIVFAATNGDFSASRVFTAISVLNSLRFPLMFYPMVITQVADAKVSIERLSRFLAQPEVDDVLKIEDSSSDLPQDPEVVHNTPIPSVAENKNLPAHDEELTAATYVTPELREINALPRGDVAIQMRDATFYWENPETRVKRLFKAEEEKYEKALKERKKKGKKFQGDLTPLTPPNIDKIPPISPVLHRVHFTIPKGQLWAVIGSVGSGKSAMCSAILHELYTSTGSVSVSGSIAYVSQIAWILNTTLRENITFAAKNPKLVTEDWYQTILDASHLRADIATLPAGDMTEIGERGINLSGGQKQRVAIARAAYSQADVYIFDDPLSALDAEVGKGVFDHCIKGVLQNKTRLLVTNALQYLSQCDGIIMLRTADADKGISSSVAAVGTFNDLMKNHTPFREMMEDYGHQEEAKGAAAVKESKAAVIDAEPAKPVSNALITAEEKAEGAIAFSVYWRYFSAGGPVLWAITMLLIGFALSQASMLVSQWWVTYWSSDSSYIVHDVGFYMGIYAAIGVSTSVFTFIRIIQLAFTAIRSSRALHKSLLMTILAAPMSFFDTTPMGRIVSRFSKDTASVDQELPNTLGMLATCIFSVVGTLVAIVFATPWFALIILPLTLVYLQVMKYFRNVSREVKRWESITRSPVYAHFSETLGGLPIIRAYKLQNMFAASNERYLSRNVGAWYTLKCCDRWLSIRLEILGNVMVLAAGLLSVGTIASNARGSTAGLAGFSLSYAMSITGMLNWTVRTMADTEQQMNSVERLTYYPDTVKPEPYDYVVGPENTKLPPNKSLSPDWPQTGAIEFRDYKMKYRDNTPFVLHGVNFKCKGGEKIGIVGRTGSGKSSIMVSLFRLIESSCHTGQILIDDVDIDTLTLTQLREKLAIIPQDPVMFSGTMRTNLDPTGILPPGPNSDAVLWRTLEKVGLKDTIAQLPGGLDAPVSEFGESLSVGQRQLVCLARVLLRDCRIILLDEATSSVDYATDAAMQKTIAESFGHCTILTIAHRLNTIINSDRVLVMDSGRVAEFDHPHVLLTKSQNGNGVNVFASLIDELGPHTASALRARAEESYLSRNNF